MRHPPRDEVSKLLSKRRCVGRTALLENGNLPHVQVSVMVEAPLEACYEIWNDRINYCQWFTLIQEVSMRA